MPQTGKKKRIKRSLQSLNFAKKVPKDEKNIFLPVWVDLLADDGYSGDNYKSQVSELIPQFGGIMAYGFTNAEETEQFGTMLKTLIEVVTSSIDKEADFPKIILESSGHPLELKLINELYADKIYGITNDYAVNKAHSGFAINQNAIKSLTDVSIYDSKVLNKI